MKNNLNVLFDCDGTLMHSLHVGMDAYNIALEKVGARVHEPDEIKRFFGQAANKIFHKLLDDKHQAEAAFEIYLEQSKKLLPNVSVHVGIEELVLNLKKSGARLGVVTGRHSRDLDLIFDHTNFHRFFDVKICDDYLAHHKPHPEGLLLAASKMGVDPKTCLYIGDAVMDMQAANAAGMKPIAALWDDWANEDEMRIESPAFLAKTPAEIWEWISGSF